MTQVTETLATLCWAATLACVECGGSKGVNVPTWENGSTVEDWERQPCANCQQRNPQTGDLDGNPKGRQFPELGRECPFDDAESAGIFLEALTAKSLIDTTYQEC